MWKAAFSSGRRHAQQKPSPEDMKPLCTEISVLLIEDDCVDREYFARILSRSSSMVLTSASCLQDGVELLRQAPFDVVLFDLGLPDSFGIDTIHRMVEEFPNHPMVVLTGLNNEEVAREASELGICDYLLKGGPTADQVLASVERAAHSNSAQPVSR